MTDQNLALQTASNQLIQVRQSVQITTQKINELNNQVQSPQNEAKQTVSSRQIRVRQLI